MRKTYLLFVFILFIMLSSICISAESEQYKKVSGTIKRIFIFEDKLFLFLDVDNNKLGENIQKYIFNATDDVEKIMLYQQGDRINMLYNDDNILFIDKQYFNVISLIFSFLSGVCIVIIAVFLFSVIFG